MNYCTGTTPAEKRAPQFLGVTFQGALIVELSGGSTASIHPSRPAIVIPSQKTNRELFTLKDPRQDVREDFDALLGGLAWPEFFHDILEGPGKGVEATWTALVLWWCGIPETLSGVTETLNELKTPPTQIENNCSKPATSGQHD